MTEKTVEQIGSDMLTAVDRFALIMRLHIASLGTVEQPVEVAPPSVPWNRDISGELSRNPGPYTEPSLIKSGGWWQRGLYEINAVTIHHTMSDSPHALANLYVHWYGGRPSLPYSIWVTQTGEVLLCLALEKGNWHDHTGHNNKSLSIGMAGRLHELTPSEVQLRATAGVCAWAIQSDMLPGVTGIEQVRGHMDVYPTACPGWLGTGEGRPSGYWKPVFYDILREVLG